MTNTSHKDTSTNSYTTTNTTSYDESDDLIPKYSFEDLPSEKDTNNENSNPVCDLANNICYLIYVAISIIIHVLLFFAPFLLVALIYDCFFN